MNNAMFRLTMAVVVVGVLVASLAACGSAPIVDDEDMRYLSRNEVSQAIADCESMSQRANISYVRTKWKGHFVNVPVDVQCVPGPKILHRWGSAN